MKKFYWSNFFAAIFLVPMTYGIIFFISVITPIINIPYFVLWTFVIVIAGLFFWVLKRKLEKQELQIRVISFVAGGVVSAVVCHLLFGGKLLVGFT